MMHEHSRYRAWSQVSLALAAGRGAATSKSRGAGGTGTSAAAAASESAEAASSGDGDEGGADESDDDSDTEGDDDAYVSDSDSDAEGVAKMLQLLEQDADVPPEALMVAGKRQRTAVDYRKLNDEMFGDAECYEGEGVDDEFKAYSRTSGSRRRKKGSDGQ
jgi:hypothetical protein